MTTQGKMDSFEQFKQELGEALVHLHDPDYHPPPLLCAAIKRAVQNGAGPVQSDIIHAIEGLRPPPDVCQQARARQDYELLYHRFVLKLTQEETAEHLHLSVRSVRRAQRAATHTLARLLWEHSLADQATQDADRKEEPRDGEEMLRDTLVPDWQAQVRQDLSCFLTQAPEAIADVGKIIARTIELERTLAARYMVNLEIGSVQPNLVVATHPSVLRQILIMAIGQLIHYASPGEIAIHAASAGEYVQLCLTAQVTAGKEPPDVSLIHEMLASQKGTLAIQTDGEHISFQIQMPSAGRITVLVADDNLDQVHFYRRCTTGTRYHIVHAPHGQRTAQAIAAANPDVIVLDILLPEIDGWELLSDLQKHPATRSIPVMICSIIREEDLAKALGAALYLPKPIHHRRFVEALSQALDQA